MVLLVLIGELPAWAQAAEPPRLSIAAGGGFGHSLHGDLNFNAPLWEVSVRGRIGRRVALEGAISEWRRTETFELRNVALIGPDGPIGQAGLIAQRSSRAARSIEVNLLALGRSGRITVSAGGGAGVLTMRRDFRQTVSECVSVVPAACADSQSSSRDASLAALGVAGAEVTIVPRVSAYGQFRFVATMRDFGSSEVRMAVGARIVLF
jgi:hypothetical protein